MKKIGKKDVLTAFLQDLKEERREGEKTAVEIHREIIASGRDISIDAVNNRLKRLRDSGKLNCRKGVINGTTVNLYSEP